MNLHQYLLPVLLALGLVTFPRPAAAESHRATRLGNPATSFAPTVYSPADLRARFASAELHPDFAEILRQWGWPGNVDDLFAAAATNEIVEWDIPVGDTMPFMSSRDNGRPICLRNVTWAGRDPIHAYAFTFISNGHHWRCVTPKPCSNFFVEDLGVAPVASLALDCSVPDQAVLGHTLQICLNLHNTGNIPETNVSVALPIPATMIATDTTEGGAMTNESVNWTISDLPVDGVKQVCAALQATQPGTLNFKATASSDGVAPVTSACETEVTGSPAILLEKAANPDPVAVGSNTTYTVRVTNQGSAEDENVAISVLVDSELVPISSDDPGATISGQRVTFPVMATLAAKQVVSHHIQARGVTTGDAHTKFIVGSQMLTSPITAEESTTVY
jgi:uncharacterized repeat protein (TIGR01451 family)